VESSLCSLWRLSTGRSLGREVGEGRDSLGSPLGVEPEGPVSLNDI
jgi:hypothetical protein